MGCFSSNGVGLLERVIVSMHAKKYQKDIINDIVAFDECFIFPLKEFIFQQDLAPPHRAKSTQKFLERKGVEILGWPDNSPDMNSIENLWSILKSRLKLMKFQSSDILWNVVQNEWYALQTRICKNLVSSMPRRLRLVRKCKGYSTKY